MVFPEEYLLTLGRAVAREEVLDGIGWGWLAYGTIERPLDGGSQELHLCLEELAFQAREAVELSGGLEDGGSLSVHDPLASISDGSEK
jgi:hypothetical protein